MPKLFTIFFLSGLVISPVVSSLLNDFFNINEILLFRADILTLLYPLFVMSISLYSFYAGKKIKIRLLSTVKLDDFNFFTPFVLLFSGLFAILFIFSQFSTRIQGIGGIEQQLIFFILIAIPSDTTIYREKNKLPENFYSTIGRRIDFLRIVLFGILIFILSATESLKQDSVFNSIYFFLFFSVLFFSIGILSSYISKKFKFYLTELFLVGAVILISFIFSQHLILVFILSFVTGCGYGIYSNEYEPISLKKPLLYAPLIPAFFAGTNFIYFNIEALLYLFFLTLPVIILKLFAVKAGNIILGDYSMMQRKSGLFYNNPDTISMLIISFLIFGVNGLNLNNNYLLAIFINYFVLTFIVKGFTKKYTIDFNV